jgi:hypothetical protein
MRVTRKAWKYLIRALICASVVVCASMFYTLTLAHWWHGHVWTIRVTAGGLSVARSDWRVISSFGVRGPPPRWATDAQVHSLLFRASVGSPLLGNHGWFLPGWLMLVVSGASFALVRNPRQRGPQFCSVCGYERGPVRRCSECGAERREPGTGDPSKNVGARSASGQ